MTKIAKFYCTISLTRIANTLITHNLSFVQ